VIDELEQAYQDASHAGEAFVVPDHLAGAPGLAEGLAALLARHEDLRGFPDDLLAALWQVAGLRTIDLVRGLELADTALANLCEIAERDGHADAPALFARLRQRRSWWLRTEATVHDAAFRTPARVAELLDAFGDDDPAGWVIAIPDEQLLPPEVQAAGVRLLARSHARMTGRDGGSTRDAHALVHVVRTISPELDAWLTEARAEPALEAPILDIVRFVGFDDPALDHHLRWLDAHGTSRGARQARAWLHRRSPWPGRFFEVTIVRPSLGALGLEVVDVAQALPHDVVGDVQGVAVEGVLEQALADPPRLGVSFVHQGTTFVATLRATPAGSTYPTGWSLIEAAALDEAEAGPLAHVALAHRARELVELIMAKGLAREKLAEVGGAVAAPEPLGRMVDCFVELGQLGLAVTASLRREDVLMALDTLVPRHLWMNGLEASQRQLWAILMDARRFDDAVTVGRVMGPWFEARALAALGRYDEALALLDHRLSRAPEIVAAEREWKEARARAKADAALKAGDQISHAKFGAGTVVRVAGDGATQKVTARFASGEKTLAASFLSRS
jgi:hypothetical protein